jgi:hypothetical protein
LNPTSAGLKPLGRCARREDEVILVTFVRTPLVA